MDTEVHEEYEEVKVEDLKEGDLINLENDEFADPYGAVGYTEDKPEGDNPDHYSSTWHDYEEDHNLLGFEWARVESAVTDQPDPTRPTAKANVIVYTDLINVRFPLGHTVKRLVTTDDTEESGEAR